MIKRRMNKRGDYNVMEIVIFIVLNLSFFIVMLLYVGRAASGAGVYEQVYAKEIGLMVDQAKPGTDIMIDMSNAISIVKSAQKDKADWSSGKILESAFKINNAENKIVVSLAGSGGYGFRYFSDYDVELKSTGIYLIVSVKTRGGAVG